MYEAKTYESIMDSLLSRVPDNYDKREGSVIWDALAPCAVELASMYIQMDTVLNETFADTASLYYLKLRCMERGIIQKKATSAVLKGVFTPSDLYIPLGTKFSCEDLNYFVSRKISDGVYELTCDETGTKGNERFGTLIPVEYIAGLQSGTLTELLIPAEDDEDVESLRQRYFSSLSTQAFGGNVADYKQKVTAIAGVGGCKVVPVWNGAGTVKLIIIDSNHSVPTSTLIQSVQTAVGLGDTGYGIAPIGHTVTVVGCGSTAINLTFTITYNSGWSWESSKSYIAKAIDDYLHELCVAWDSNENITVRTSYIESRILALDAVLDITNIKINGATANLQIASDKIPKRGTINGATVN